MDQNEIIDGLKIICKCQSINKKTLRKHIAAGANTVAELQQITGAGQGDCQGKQCTPRLEALLQSVITKHHSHKSTHDDPQGEADL